MEVRDKNIDDSKFGLPRFSSVEAASIMETEYEGSTVKYAAKLHSPDETGNLPLPRRNMIILSLFE